MLNPVTQMRNHLLLGVAACLLLPDTSLADAPFTPVIREKIGVVSSASVFPVDANQEIAFRQKRQAPASAKKLTNKQRETLWLQSIRDQEDFLATQRRNPVVLTAGQWEELSAILRDKAIYRPGLFCIADEPVCAVEAQSAGGTLTIVIGRYLVSVLTLTAQDNAWLDDQGMARLNAWKKSVGIAGRD